MMGRGGGGRGRGRHRREYSPRLEEKGGHSGSSRSSAPPSRHLWVGNLSPHMSESLLSEQFLRFGDLESVAFLPGRSYAFVNYKKEEDAVIALRALQGFVVAGTPLRIEFQKGDKSSSFLLDGDYTQYRDERHSVERGEYFPQRDARIHLTTPENSKGNKSSEPSEVLWIGFPSFLNVDEGILGRTFSPFGEIEKITTFPGRSYAFVRYRSVVAACRAKEALQGRLFNNPRVSICFARSDLAPSEHVRDFKSSFHPGLSDRVDETAQFDRNFDSPVGEFNMASSRFFSDMETVPRDAGIAGFVRNNMLGIDSGPGPNSGAAFESIRFQGLGSGQSLSEEPYDYYRNSPLLDPGALRHDLSVERPRRGPQFEDTWPVENDAFPLAKKMRMDTFPDKELPRYSFSDFDKQIDRSGLRKFFPEFAERPTSMINSESIPFRYKGLPDHSRNSTHPQENDDLWRTDAFDVGPGQSHANPIKLQRQTPESHKPLNGEWKWEGTIAKGGTPVCRARCFPVGKVSDIMLPEFLDCTARTGLDMLAKHFYQAAGSWVVFFVPETDADIVFYNEFMHYLGEKQRAAVAKLGDKTTLFLVPPSDFSEQVLKVPGKVSISGVILRFQQATSNFIALHHPLEAVDSKPLSYAGQASNIKDFQDDSPQVKHLSTDFRPSHGQCHLSSSSEHITSTTFSALNKSAGVIPYSGALPQNEKEKISTSIGESRYDQLQHQNPNLPPNWPTHEVHIPNANAGNLSSSATNAPSCPFDNPMVQEYPIPKSSSVQGMTPSHYTPGNSDNVLAVGGKFPHPQETRSQIPPTAPAPSLQPEQLAQLAALLEQQKRLGKDPVLSSNGDHRQPNLLEKTGAHTSPSSDSSASQVSQVPQLLQQYPSNVSAVHQTSGPENHGSQQVPPSGREETEADPQKRLQATLQLAAALLQQIQHQSKGEQQ